MKEIRTDAWLAIGVIVVAASYLYADWRLPTQTIGDSLGPRVFPALVGIGLLISGLLLIVETWKKRRALGHDASGPGLPQTPEQRKQIMILAAMVAWTALYYGAFQYLGYLLATVTFLFGLLSYFNQRRYTMNILVAVGFALVVDLGFSRLLGVPMPAGLLSI